MKCSPIHPPATAKHPWAVVGLGKDTMQANAEGADGVVLLRKTRCVEKLGLMAAWSSVQTISTQVHTHIPLGSAPNLPGSPQVPSSLTTQKRQHCLPMMSLAPGSSSVCWGVCTREGTGIWAHRQTVPYGTFQKRTFSRGGVSVCGGVHGFVYRPYKEKMRTGQGPSASWRALGHTLHWAPAP